MTVLADALVVAGGIFLGRVLARVVVRRKRKSVAVGPASPGPSDRFEGWPARLGDVLVRRVERDEAWLAGGLLFAEESPVAALFVAPEGVGERAVYVRPGFVVWLSAAPGALTPPLREPPSSLEVDGTRFDRSRRLPVRVQAMGTGAPAVGDRAVLGEYTARAGVDRLVVVAGADALWVGRGAVLSDGEYEVLPGGSATLDVPRST
ncbi:MAG TPA: hypothetical protein VKU41_09545 [Polyangiaceae bacterium]|nr:hypothetical protein [Polyangiaceae bacterium]